MPPQPKEAGEVRGIHRQTWERLERCVGNIEASESPKSSWVPALYGVAATAAMGAIPEGLTGAGTGHWVAMVLFGAVAVFGALSARIVQGAEERAERHHVNHVTVLNTEMAVAKTYMVEVEVVDQSEGGK
jgi:hypothetical protein